MAWCGWYYASMSKKKRTVTLVKGQPDGLSGRPKYWAYGYDALAKVLGVSREQLKYLVLSRQLDPGSLVSICKEYCKRNSGTD